MLTREDVDVVLEKYGPYQRRLFFLLAFPLLMKGYNTMSVVLTFFTPKHRCHIPEWPNDTFAIQDDNHLDVVNRSIPMVEKNGEESYAECTLYALRNLSHNVFVGEDDTSKCDSWVYDESQFEKTAASQFDVVCDNKTFRANLNMIFMIGLLIGSPVSGILCDKFGRKKIFVSSFILSAAVGVAMAFPVVPEMLMVYRFLSGFFGIASYLSLYVLALECMGPKQRTFSSTMLMLLWLLGPFTLAGVSYLVTDWRYIQVIGNAPFFLCVLYFWWLPESPRWLMYKGRVEEAEKVLTKIAAINKLPMPDSSKVEKAELQNGVGTKEDGTEHKRPCETEEKALPRESPLKLLKYPNLIARSCIIFFNWCVISMTYYGLSLNVSNLAGSVRFNFLLSNVVELLGYSLAWLLLDRVGRKRLHCGAMLLAGSACLATIFSVTFGGHDLEWLTIALAMTGKLGISAAFNSVYLMSGELFPTVMRNFGIGCSSTVARVGSAVSPYIADMGLYVGGDFGPALPLVIFGGFALAAGFLAIFLPETLNRKLPDTILEAANFTKSQKDESIDMDKLQGKTKLSDSSQEKY